jgi:serine/threonine protein kinase
VQRSETLRSRGGEPSPSDPVSPEVSPGQRALTESGEGEVQATAASTPRAQSSEPEPSSVPWQSSVLAPGLELAQRYRIIRFVARGGMGEVYEARDEALGERIALKTVAAHSSGDSEALEALKVEVQLARRISHKNVCRIFDIGKHQPIDGPPVSFLTMEFIDGSSLAEVIRSRKKVPAPEVRRIAVGILEGLDAAHRAGVIHRDLKSDNVMLRTFREGHVEPVLMDFGLASALNPNSSRVSGDQALVGSLAYMAPEQVRGEPLRIGTDLYAFGVILFEMLTGRLPFEGPTPAIAAIRRLQEPAPKLCSVDPTLPVDLEEIVRRCLERDSKRRYPSAQSILDALTREVPVTASSAPSSERDLAPTESAPVQPQPASSGHLRVVSSRKGASPSEHAPSQRPTPSSAPGGMGRERRLWITLLLALITVGFLARGVFTRAPLSSETPREQPTPHVQAKRDGVAEEAKVGQVTKEPATPPHSTAGGGEPASRGVVDEAPATSALGAATDSPRTAAPKRDGKATGRAPRAPGISEPAAVLGVAPSSLPSGVELVRACPPGLLCPDSLSHKPQD